MGHPLSVLDRYLALTEELLSIREGRGPLSQDEEGEYAERLNDLRSHMTPEEQEQVSRERWLKLTKPKDTDTNGDTGHQES